MLVKSPILEVRELDLFLAIVERCKQDNDAISDDDVKLLFQHIRYPLIMIQKNDLIKKVHPTNMADPDLYKAALEYHDTDKFDGPKDQLKLRKFYFEFEPLEYGDADVKIEHTAKGNFIKNNGLATSVNCVAIMEIKRYDKIPFTFCLKSCQNKHKMLLKLCDSSNDIELDAQNVAKLPIGKEVQGIISHRGDGIEAHIGNVELYMDSPTEEICEIGMKLYIGDYVHIKTHGSVSQWRSQGCA